MKVTINEREIELVYSIRTNILYESMLGKTLDYTQISTLESISTLFYVNILSSMQAHHLNLDFTWDDYINWLDSINPYEVINNYAIWLSEQMDIQAKLIESKLNKDTVKEERKKKKTKKD